MVTALHPGARFAERYEVVRCIDLGGMGAIYEVIHLETRRRRALKLMLPSVVENEDLRKRFKLEATVAAEVESEHIVETFDAGIDEATGAPFLVMELLRGVDVSALLTRLGRFEPEDALLVLRQVALGLDKTHAADIVHRDLKPENLFVGERDDGSLRVKILDFGIAKVVVANVSQPAKTKVMGTPLYMAPEQLTGDGRVAPAADRYALAMMAFSLLVGRAYWKDEADAAASIFSFLLRVMEGYPELASARAARLGVTLPPAFDGWFERAAAKDPSARFESAVAQIEALAAALEATDQEPSAAFRAAFDEVTEEADRRREEAAARTMASEPPQATGPKIGAALTQQPLTSDAATDRPEGVSRWSLGVAVGVALGAIVIAFTALDRPQHEATPAGAGDTASRAETVAPPLPEAQASSVHERGAEVAPTDSAATAKPAEDTPAEDTPAEDTPAEATPGVPATPAPPAPQPKWPPPKASSPEPKPEPKPEPAIDPLKIR